MFEFPFLKKFSKLKIKRKKEIEPQEIFLDKLAQKREQEIGITEKKFEVPLSNKIISGFFILFVIIGLGGLGKTFYFQVIKNKELSALARENKFIIDLIYSNRGVIYDVNGKQLVYNKLSFDLIFNGKNDVDEKSIQELAEILKIDTLEMENKIKKGGKIAENLDHQTLIILQAKNFPGFEIKENLIRYYENGPIFSHLIGYTDSDNIGKDGLEKYYEDYLKKNPGEVQIERDAYGNILSKKLISMPKSGNSLVLWIDSGLQKKAEETLKNIMKKSGAQKAVAIAQNPQNGAVIALVNVPGYNNNLFNKEADQQALLQLLNNEDQPLFNRAIAGLYATGSTIKPLIAAAALKEDIISPNKNIYCQGKISVPHKYDPSIIYHYKDWAIHGFTNMRKAIAESCNVYFYTIGGGYEDQKGLGPTKIKENLKLFGWSSKTGIDLPGEVKGLIPSPAWKKEIKNEDWWDGDTYNLSIGQGDILITPIQVINAFSAIANGGTLFKPQIVKKIIDSEKNVVKEFAPQIIRNNFIDSDYLKIVKEGMRKAVTGEGAPQASSIMLNSLPIAAAAKTGTAETPYKKVYHNWVTVFAPYENPEIVLTIILENIPGVQAAALPAAKNILQWYFTQ